MNDYIILGKIGSTYGIHGWLKITSYTSPQSNIFEYKHWLIKNNNEWTPLTLEDKAIHGHTLLAKLPDINTPEAAKEWTHTLIATERNNLPKLADDEHYWADLIGCSVITTNNITLGIVKRILETGTNDVFIVEGEQRHLIPYTDDVIQSIDIHHKQISVSWDLTE